MKVLLISLPVVVARETTKFTYLESMALLYLGSALRAQGIEVEAWDSLLLGAIPGLQGYITNIELGEYTLQGANPQYLQYKISQCKPDIIGISIAYTSQHNFAVELMKSIKEAYQNIIIIIGGPHVTQNPQKCVACEYVDYLIAGEGEIAMPMLVKELEAGNTEPDIPGVWYKDKASSFELIEDIDIINPPAWYLLPAGGEFMHWCNLEGRKISIYSSRGCPYDCTFCSSALLNRRKWRAHSVDRVLEEIDWLVKKHRVRGILFRDDNPTVDLHRYHNIMEGIAKEDYGILLEGANFRADRLPKETLWVMKEAGFKRINLFPESGNQRVINELMNKHLDLKDFHETVDNILSTGMDVGVCLLIGMPGETKEEINDTFNMALALKEKGVAYFQVSTATPMRGTRMYDDCVKAGYFDEVEPEDFAYEFGNFDTEHWTAVWLTCMRDKMIEDLN